MSHLPGTASTAIAGSDAFLLQHGDGVASSHLRIEVAEVLNERKGTAMMNAAAIKSFLESRLRMPFAAFDLSVDELNVFPASENRER